MENPPEVVKMKLLGYILAVLGLALVALSKVISAKISILKELYVIIGGVILVAVGIVLLLSNSSGNVNQASEEVPIYSGTGKHRKIVGYQKAK